LAYTFRGIGVLEYGRRDFGGNGSYITTRWFVVFYLPIIPLKSMRLRRTGQAKYYGLNRAPTYEKIDLERICWPQVIATYGWFAAGISLAIATQFERVKRVAGRHSMGFTVDSIE